jgi:hypothetical protein
MDSKMSAIVENEETIMNEAWNIRRRVDRRVNKKASSKYILFGGRRGFVRRQSDSSKVPIMDRYDKKILIYSALILMLSILDGYLTLYLTTMGAVTLNPLMKKIFIAGPVFIIIFKFFITFISIICLQILHKVRIDFLKVRVENLFPVIVIVLCLANIWNITLIIQ